MEAQKKKQRLEDINQPKEQKQILSHYSSLPTQVVNPHSTILLVGNQGVGKKTFAQVLLQAQNITFQIRMSSKLPLPPPKENVQRPKVDFIVFVMDLTNRSSFNSIAYFLTLVDVEYFLGKSCIIATHAEKQSHYSIGIEELEQLAENYDIQFFLNETSSKALLDKISYLIELSCGYKNQVTPLSLKTTLL